MPALLQRFVPGIGLAALLIIAVLSVGLTHQGRRIALMRSQLASETARHQADLATIRAAQAKANADHLAQIDRLNSRYRSMKDEADRHADRLSGDYAARVLRLPAATDSCRAGTAELPRTGPASRPDRAGPDAVLLARSDALICATNTARLQAAHEWALALPEQD